MGDVTFVWLEVTGKCQLRCTHCYAESGPSGTHGTMDTVDWLRVIDQAVGLGVTTVQFIGGEPTLHPRLKSLVEHSLRQGMSVEVFSNLVHITDDLWEVLSQPGVSLATSYYSDQPEQHAAITGRSSYARTKGNITKAIRRGIPLRAGVIDLGAGQRADHAQKELNDLGVFSVGYDLLRQVGRGVRDQQASAEQLCGHCADGVAAISPDGVVWPCVFARWLPIGNVLEDDLADILASPEADRVRSELGRTFASGNPAQWEGLGEKCHPDCSPTCDPCNPRCNPGCQPYCAPSPCQPKCSPSCSPTCNPISCKPNACWPPFQ
ncbi:MAG: radical SAM protein [Pseudonocardiaceae bacterium]